MDSSRYAPYFFLTVGKIETCKGVFCTKTYVIVFFYPKIYPKCQNHASSIHAVYRRRWLNYALWDNFGK